MSPDVQSKPLPAHFWTIPTCLIIGYQNWRRSAPPSSLLNLSKLERTMRSHLSLLLYGLEKLRVFSCSSQEVPSNPFTSLAALLWMHPKTFYTLLNLRGSELRTALKLKPHQHWIQQNKCLFWPASDVVFGALQNGLAAGAHTLLAPGGHPANMHPQIPFCRAVSSHCSLNLYLCPALLCFRCRIQHFNSLNFIPFISAQCSNLSGSICKASCSSTESAAFPRLISSANLLILHSTPAFRLMGSVLKQTWP